jgi:hypothetical protein
MVSAVPTIPARRLSFRRGTGPFCPIEPGSADRVYSRDRLRSCREMGSEQEDFMAVDTSMFAQVIQDHLDLKRRNAALEHEMPLEKYLTDDPFENHPLFKTEEQARFEDTMDGVQGIEAEETSLDWPTTDDTFVEAPTVEAAELAPGEHAEPGEHDAPSDENLWSRSRDFDWGD